MSISFSFRRIKAIVIQQWYQATRTMETWVDLMWFPTISLLFFGFLSVILANSNPSLAASLIFGYIFWESVRIAQYCVSVSMMWEIWSESFNSLFVTPISLKELTLGYIFSGTIKTFFAALIMAVVGYLAYGENILSLGPLLIWYVATLLPFGFAAGLFINGLIIRHNTQIQSLAWGMIYIFQPISAIFYPVEALPAAIRWLAYTSPITYVMENVRAQLTGQPINIHFALIGFGLSAAYFVLSYVFLNIMMKKSRHIGQFARLGN